MAQIQRDLAIATNIITAAAASGGLPDAPQHTDRLRRALTDLDRGWGQLSLALAQLAGRARRLDPEVRVAS